jgi:hypothetical protein
MVGTDIFPASTAAPMFSSILDQWSTWSSQEQLYWSLAVFFSLLFVVHSGISFLGSDGVMDGDADADIAGDEGAGYQMFTIRNLIIFFTLFGWTGLAGLRYGLDPLPTLLIASAAGALMVGTMMFLFVRISRMKHSGNLRIDNAIGLTAFTYLTIPPARSGFGKVHVRVQGGLKELDAITDHSEAIATSTMVKVVKVIDGRFLLVSTQTD